MLPGQHQHQHQHQHHPVDGNVNMEVLPTSQQAPHPVAPSQYHRGDYVYVDRSTAGISKATLDRASAVKLKLEHFYKLTVDQTVERNQR
jgi:protein-serine/threonine kinase